MCAQLVLHFEVFLCKCLCEIIMEVSYVQLFTDFWNCLILLLRFDLKGFINSHPDTVPFRLCSNVPEKEIVD